VYRPNDFISELNKTNEPGANKPRGEKAGERISVGANKPGANRQRGEQYIIHSQSSTFSAVFTII